THPNLVLGAVLARPGEDPGGTGARLLASIRSRGHRPGFLGADRAYSAALPEKFHLPAQALGYSLVMDYRIDQLGRQANSGGAVLVEGTWYCPSMPEALVSATVDFRGGVIDEATWKARITARGPYALKRKDGPDDDGYERLTCPALGDHPGLACPLREASLVPRDGRMKVVDPPTDPPKLCRQSAITIAPDVGARHRQPLAFGTEAWARRYATLRNTIEGTNGYLKDPAHEALGQPGRRRVRGIAAQSIFAAFLVIAANLRKIRAFRALVAEGKANQVASRARRRRVSLGDYLPATG
ncbi:MAG: transposase, partial [Acidimicrobiales bacterium]